MCRAYTREDVALETLEVILDAAGRAPSAGHTQPQEFVVVTDQRTKDALAHAALDQMFLAEAPVIVAVVADTKRSSRRYGRRGVEFYSIIDGAFSSLLMLLAAVDEGLGAAFVAAFDDDEVASVLRLPRHVRPIGLISIGHCADARHRLERRPRSELIHRDRYGVR